MALHVMREADTDGHLESELREKEERLRERKLQLHDVCRKVIVELEKFGKKP